MNEDLPIKSDVTKTEDIDPWTFFGSYSDEDIAAARNLLQQACLTFHITGETVPKTSFTPHHLWVHDDHVGQAQSILVPYFETNGSSA